MDQKLKDFSLLVTLFLIAFSIYSINVNNLSFNSPDEAVLEFFTSNYRESGKMYIPVNETSHNDIIRIRGTEIIDSKIVPLKFIGYPYLFGIITTVSHKILPYISTFLAAILIVVIFLLSRELFDDRKAAFFSTFVLMLLPFYWYWANHPFFENISSVFFFFIGYYYFIKIFDHPQSIRNYLLTGLFYGIAFIIRFDTGILMLAMALPYLAEIRNLNKKYLVLSFVMFFLVLSPILLINKAAYGEYFTYGQKILSSDSDPIPKKLDNVILNYLWIWKFFPLILFFVVGLLFELINGSSKSKKSALGLSFFILIFSYIYFSEFAPKHPNALHESFTRYSLIFYIFSSAYLGRFLSLLKSKKIALSVFMAILCLSVISTTPILAWQWESTEINLRTAEEVKSLIPKESYVIVAGDDKYLYSQINAIPINNFRVGTGEVDYSLVNKKILSLSEKSEGYIFAKYLDIRNFESPHYSYELINKELNLYKIHLKNEA